MRTPSHYSCGCLFVPEMGRQCSKTYIQWAASRKINSPSYIIILPPPCRSHCCPPKKDGLRHLQPDAVRDQVEHWKNFIMNIKCISWLSGFFSSFAKFSCALPVIRLPSNQGDPDQVLFVFLFSRNLDDDLLAVCFC